MTCRVKSPPKSTKGVIHVESATREVVSLPQIDKKLKRGAAFQEKKTEKEEAKSKRKPVLQKATLIAAKSNKLDGSDEDEEDDDDSATSEIGESEQEAKQKASTPSKPPASPPSKTAQKKKVDTFAFDESSEEEEDLKESPVKELKKQVVPRKAGIVTRGKATTTYDKRGDKPVEKKVVKPVEKTTTKQASIQLIKEPVAPMHRSPVAKPPVGSKSVPMTKGATRDAAVKKLSKKTNGVLRIILTELLGLQASIRDKKDQLVVCHIRTPTLIYTPPSECFDLHMCSMLMLICAFFK